MLTLALPVAQSASPDARWREMTTGVYTNIDQKDLAVLDVGRLLEPS